jgi:hypothetical protein
LIAGKLDEVELDLTVPDHDGSDHQLCHATLFFEAHLGPAGVEVEGFGDHLLA